MNTPPECAVIIAHRTSARKRIHRVLTPSVCPATIHVILRHSCSHRFLVAVTRQNSATPAVCLCGPVWHERWHQSLVTGPAFPDEGKLAFLLA